MPPSILNKSDNIRLEELINSVMSLQNKITQQESNISKKLDKALQSLNNIISKNSKLKEKISVLENKIMCFEQTDFYIELSDRDHRALFSMPQNLPRFLLI
ncbi:unnamed protein product [Macrosiphum euphorbiae]|uniref:Uncharacterized protein n=1 Tax=Macrosiphum euphorbiae TaxID=13131 RepID=A0AAV0WQN5_9HEMI|nr:unnamed protein product [Macrosiphum euphorbiae]